MKIPSNSDFTLEKGVDWAVNAINSGVSQDRVFRVLLKMGFRYQRHKLFDDLTVRGFDQDAATIFQMTFSPEAIENYVQEAIASDETPEILYAQLMNLGNTIVIKTLQDADEHGNLFRNIHSIPLG